VIGNQSISNQPHWRGAHLARWLQVGTRILWQLEPTWLLLNEDASWNKQSVIGRLFGVDNRPKQYRCTSSFKGTVSVCLSQWQYARQQQSRAVALHVLCASSAACDVVGVRKLTEFWSCCTREVQCVYQLMMQASLRVMTGVAFSALTVGWASGRASSLIKIEW